MTEKTKRLRIPDLDYLLCFSEQHLPPGQLGDLVNFQVPFKYVSGEHNGPLWIPSSLWVSHSHIPLSSDLPAWTLAGGSVVLLSYMVTGRPPRLGSPNRG